MSVFELELKLRVEFLPAVPLVDIEKHRKALSFSGVYFLMESEGEAIHDPLAGHIIYIGKGIRENIATRGRKHLATMTGALLKTGNPKTQNSAAFKAYRETIGLDASGLWFLAGKMDASEPYLISCAEEYFLQQFEKHHGKGPVCNTASLARKR